MTDRLCDNGLYSIALLGTRTSREKKMTYTSLWSIKVENGQVFVYLGKEKLKMHQVYRGVLSVKKFLYKGKDSLLVRTNLFIWLINSFFYLRSIRRSGLTLALYVMFLQFKFEPCPNGTHTKCHLKVKYCDPYASDGIFRDILEGQSQRFCVPVQSSNRKGRSQWSQCCKC